MNNRNSSSTQHLSLMVWGVERGTTYRVPCGGWYEGKRNEGDVVVDSSIFHGGVLSVTSYGHKNRIIGIHNNWIPSTTLFITFSYLRTRSTPIFRSAFPDSSLERQLLLATMTRSRPLPPGPSDPLDRMLRGEKLQVNTDAL